MITVTRFGNSKRFCPCGGNTLQNPHNLVDRAGLPFLSFSTYSSSDIEYDHLSSLVRSVKSVHGQQIFQKIAGATFKISSFSKKSALHPIKSIYKHPLRRPVELLLNF